MHVLSNEEARSVLCGLDGRLPTVPFRTARDASEPVRSYSTTSMGPQEEALSPSDGRWWGREPVSTSIALLPDKDLAVT